MFTTDNKDWKTGKIWESWTNYSSSFGNGRDYNLLRSFKNLNSAITDDAIGDESPDSWATLEFDKDGYPILPERPKNATLPAIKKMVRIFVRAVYSKDFISMLLLKFD
jgi:hypothetical protein